MLKAQRLFSILICTGLLAITATGISAQTGMSDLKKRIFEQAGAGKIPELATSTEATTSTEPQRRNPIAESDKKKALLGTWNVILTFGDGTEVKSTLQVFPGATDDDGSVIHASEFSLTPPNPTLPEQGVWEYVKGRRFIASYKGYSFTDQLAPFGTIGFHHSILVSPNQETFTGEAVFEVIDSSSHVLFSDNLRSRGVRQHAVAP